MINYKILLLLLKFKFKLMKKFIIYSLVLGIVFASCKKDEEETTPPASTTTEPADNNAAGTTITSDNFAIAGNNYYYKIDTSDVNTISLMAIDSLVNLTMLSADDSDTTKYRNPSDFASYTNFPNANLAMETDQYIIYMTKTTDKLEVIGVYMALDTIELSIPFTDRLTLIKFPITEGDSISDYGTGSTSINVPYNGFNIPVTITVQMQNDYVIQAQEKIETPIGIETCLKEFKTLNTIMSTSPDFGYGQNDTTMTYNYYSNNKAEAYVEISLDADTNITKFRYLE